MTAVSGNITGSNTSASFTPTKDTSEVLVTRNSSAGEIHLEAYNPTGTVWLPIGGQGSYGVVTPDYAIVYRFRSEGTGADFDYYIGP